jgi:hypothetical protein
MMLRRFSPLYLAAAPIALVGTLLPRVAFAQTDSTVEPLSNLSATSITIACLAGIVALLTSMYNTGTFFGLKTVPQTWLPYVGVALPFFGSAAISLHGVTTLTALAIANALQQGFYALLGSGAGTLLHAPLDRHVNQPVVVKAAMKAAAKAAVILCCLGAMVTGVSACGATLDAIVQGVESFTGIVTNGLKAGQTDVQIVDALEAALGASATVTQATNLLLSILNTVLTSGLLAKEHPALVPAAEAMASQTAPTIVAKVMAAHAAKTGGAQ